MAKRGRKSGLNEKVKETILRLLKDGKTEDDVAEVIGICRKTLSNWKGKHPELLHAVNEAKLTADELVELSLFGRAVGFKGGIPDTQAAIFWLRNRRPKQWREKSEGDVNVNNNMSVSGLTDEQLDAKLTAMLAKQEKRR